jgi:hypothetical protein
MNRKKYAIFAMGLLFIVGITFALFETKHDEQYSEFRCNGPTRYFLEDEEIMVNQDLRIAGMNTAYLTLEGYVSVQGTRKKLHRILYMNNGKKTFKHSYLFRISDIHKSVNDTVSDQEFEPLLMELTGDKSIIALDINPLSDNLYLIGTPLSYIFTCNSY